MATTANHRDSGVTPSFIDSHASKADQNTAMQQIYLTVDHTSFLVVVIGSRFEFTAGYRLVRPLLSESSVLPSVAHIPIYPCTNILTHIR